MVLTQRIFGKTSQGIEITCYKLENKNGTIVEIIDYGATILTLSVADKRGRLDDIALGLDDVKGYEEDFRFFGATIGRNTNRIPQGKFSLDGQQYTLPINHGPNHLHGGPNGFHKVVWKSKSLGDTSVEMTYNSRDGEEGYPGELAVRQTFELTDDGTNELILSFSATTNKPTPVSLSNHSLFNLAGQGSPNIYHHKINIPSDCYTPFDGNLAPSGSIEGVDGKPFDLRQPVLLSDLIPDATSGGLDINYVLEATNERHLAARLEDTVSGRIMEVYTTGPAIQFYTGNFLDGSMAAKRGSSYPKHSGICLFPQEFPNAVNQSNFPSCILRPSETYQHTIWYRFAAN